MVGASFTPLGGRPKEDEGEMPRSLNSPSPHNRLEH